MTLMGGRDWPNDAASRGSYWLGRARCDAHETMNLTLGAEGDGLSVTHVPLIGTLQLGLARITLAVSRADARGYAAPLTSEQIGEVSQTLRRSFRWRSRSVNRSRVLLSRPPACGACASIRRAPSARCDDSGEPADPRSRRANVLQNICIGQIRPTSAPSGDPRGGRSAAEELSCIGIGSWAVQRSERSAELNAYKRFSISNSAGTSSAKTNDTSWRSHGH